MIFQVLEYLVSLHLSWLKYDLNIFFLKMGKWAAYFLGFLIPENVLLLPFYKDGIFKLYNYWALALLLELQMLFDYFSGILFFLQKRILW